MLILFGERVYSEADSAGMHECGVCAKQRHFSHVVETNYFCIFGIRLLPIEKIANYLQCDYCNNPFSADNTKEPTQIVVLKRVLAYIQSGYAMQEHREVAQDICIKVSCFEFQDEEFDREIHNANMKKSDIFEFLKTSASSLNMRAKQEIIEAAFLMTNACCEIQFEDRLRINLIGSALDLSIEFVGSVIDHVHSQGCYGVRRLLPTRSQIIE